jgi:hypothetical protein
MIRPRLPKVATGTRLTTDLVNDIINRTEYAADLLRQYKLVAGNGMYVEPHFDGTRVSYLQPVGGGATPRQPIASSIFRAVFGSQTIYDPFADTFTTLDGTIAGDSYVAIKGNVVAGFNNTLFFPNTPTPVGMIYNGTSFTRVNFGIGRTYTQFYGTDGKTVVGEYIAPDTESFSTFGVQCDLSGQKIQDVIFPKQVSIGNYRNQGLVLADVYDENIIGQVNVANTAGQQFLYSFIFNGGFTILSSSFNESPAFEPAKIYKDYIISYDGKIYSISAGAIIKTILYQGTPVIVRGLFENIVSCIIAFSPFSDLLYYIDRDEFEVVDYNGDIG